VNAEVYDYEGKFLEEIETDFEIGTKNQRLENPKIFGLENSFLGSIKTPGLDYVRKFVFDK